MTPEREGLGIGITCISAFGVGLVLVPSITIALTVVPDNVIGTCVALSVAFRSLGGAIGAAVYYNVFISKLKEKLPVYVAEFAVEAGLPPAEVVPFATAFLTDQAALVQIPGITPLIIEAATIGSRWAYAEGLKYVFLTSIAFGSCSIVLAAFVGDISKYMTDRVAATIS